MHISEFDYELPSELIAQEPLQRRDASRMLVLNRQDQTWHDSEFSALSSYLEKNDVVVINNTRVFPARLTGNRYPSGGRVEVMLVREIGPLRWEALVRPSQRLKQRDVLHFGDGRLSAELLDKPGNDLRKLRLDCSEPLEPLLDEIGLTPLPPYIKRESGGAEIDRERYQTVYARHRGAVAAPTAGLHFTPGSIDELRAKGIEVVEITLHVGYGTFAPVRVEQVESHSVAAERIEISPEAVEKISKSRSSGGRIIAVGTTTTRALESSVMLQGEIKAGSSSTELTITPGFRFRAVDVLLTNFHLPRSSLLLLVAAFAGRELVLRAYHHAVKEGYRFYSYGDCMLIL
jgi:S-adenosylmethionine:tRNA ribosyltransferase-isomerase